MNTAEFIERARATHGDKYDYSKTVYTTSKHKVIIICPLHGEFEQRADHHSGGSGCNTCVTTRGGALTRDQFIDRARDVHGDRYDYSKVVYVTMKSHVTIICPDHGEFLKSPESHIKGRGCLKCFDGRGLIPFTVSQFIENARDVHGDRYDYSKVVYVTAQVEVSIICPDHGEFQQTPDNHCSKSTGCPKCARLQSNPEQYIADYVRSLGFDVEQNMRGLFANNRFEADILVQSKKVVIEYNGGIWHSERFGRSRYNIKEKSAMAQAAGYRCIHIREDQYLENPDLIHGLLRSALGVFDHRIGARQCERRTINVAEYRTLCAENHLAGYRIAGVKVGLFYKDELVAAIGYNQRNGELIRYVVKAGWQVMGALPKLLKGEDVTFSFCDLTFFTGDSYPKAGFELVEITRPNYRYVKGVDTVGRQTRMKHRLPDIFPGCDMSMTEVEINAANGWYRLFDCGNAKYVLQR